MKRPYFYKQNKAKQKAIDKQKHDEFIENLDDATARLNGYTVIRKRGDKTYRNGVLQCTQ